MDEIDCLLNSAENARRLKKSAKELEEGTKDDLFGILADKEQDVDDYMQELRQGRGV